jgi:hypothetical protein
MALTNPLELPTWSRPDFVAGAGDAFVQFAIYGTFDLETPLDRELYRSERVPNGFELLYYDRHKNPAGFSAFFKSHAWQFAAEERPQFAEVAYRAEQMALLRGFARDPQTLNYLRDSIGIVTYLFDRGGTLCYDQMLLLFWTRDQWKREIFKPARPLPYKHVLILRQPTDGGREWIFTRGLRLFGRPDLSVRNVGAKYQEKVVELLNRYIEYQVNGGTILEGDVVTLDGLPADGTCVLDDRLDHPNFHNRHVDIIWPPGSFE